MLHLITIVTIEAMHTKLVALAENLPEMKFPLKRSFVFIEIIHF